MKGLRAIAAIVAGCAPLTLALVPQAVLAGNSVTATIDIAVRSVTVTPSTITYGNCVDGSGQSTATGLVAGGACNTGATTITITNGPVGGTIDVNGADAIPSDNGTHWTLCGGNGAPNCTGSSNPTQPPYPIFAGNLPGPNQFAEETNSTAANGGTILSGTPQCDRAFANPAVCTATAGQVATGEVLTLWGPQSWTDPSLTFTTVVTWTAAP
ncbi:MAG TPA: hypothetical protein VF137_05740 [Candidatus Dormibacteraeota bacterium]